MNVETGALYYGAAVDTARLRGEPIVEISDHVAELIRLGKSRFSEPDTTTLEDLKKRIEALEGVGETDRRMKALGLVMPD